MTRTLPYLVLLLACLTNQTAKALDYSIHYGSKDDGSEASLFTNSSGQGFDASNKGLLVVGYFDLGYDLQTGINEEGFLGYFNVLGSTNFDAATDAGHLKVNLPEVEVNSDQAMYLLVLQGVSKFSEVDENTEIALLRDLTFGALPKQSDLGITEYEASAVSFDELLIGTEKKGQALSGNLSGKSGNLYATESLEVHPGLVGSFQYPPLNLHPTSVFENQPADQFVGHLTVGPSVAKVGTKLWEFETGDEIFSSPLIGPDGSIYFGSRDDYFYALHPKTRALKWKYRGEGSFNGSASLSEDGVLYVGSDDKHLYAFDSETGEVLWKFKTEGTIIGIPAIDEDGNIYFGSYDFYFYKLDGKTGGKIWDLKTGWRVRSSAVLGPNGMLYVGSDDTFLYAINRETGERKWKFSTSGDITSTPLLTPEGVLYFGSFDDHIYAVDADSGQEIWKVKTFWNVSSSPTMGLDGTIYIGSQDGHLYALEPETGQTLWKFNTREYMLSTPAIGADGTVYTGSHDSYFYALDGTNGSVKWKYKTGGNIHASPQIDSLGVVYIPSYDHKVYAFQGAAPAAVTIKSTFTQNNHQSKSPWMEVPADSIAYAFAEGDGDSDNTKFRLDGDQLYILESADYETKPFYTVRIRATQESVGSVERSIQVTVRDIPEPPPPAISLTNLKIEENGPKREIVSDLSYSIPATPQPDVPEELVGTKIWEFETGDKVQSSPTLGPNGFLYVGSNDNNLYALDIATGNKRWEFQTGADIFSTPAISLDGTVYVGSFDNKLYALDGWDGTKLWEFEAKNKIFSSPAVGLDGTVYIGSDDKKLYALDGKTGAMKWEFLTGGEVDSSPAIAEDGTVYVGADDGKLYALDSATGTLKWEFEQSGLKGPLNSSPTIGQDGTVYVGSYNYKLFAINSADGTLKWEFKAGSELFSSPSIGADGTIYIGSWDKRIYALNPEDGSELWNYRTRQPIWSSPAISGDNTVYIGSDDGSFYAFNGETGKFDWKYKTGGRPSSPVIGENGVVYFGSHDGKVYALQGSSGIADSPWPMFRHSPNRTALENSGYFITKRPAATFAFIDGEGSTDNGSFTIEGEQLILTNPANFEEQSSYSVRIQATTEDGTTEMQFTFDVVDMPEPPSKVELESNKVEENSPASTLVGTLIATDPDKDDTHTFALLDSETYPDNAAFQIEGDQLKTAMPLDYESQNVYMVRVEATDSTGLTRIQKLRVDVTDVFENSAPTDILLSNSKFPENAEGGSRIGDLSAVDINETDTHTFRLVNAPDGEPNDNALFGINGVELQTAIDSVFNFEAKNEYTIWVETKDQDGAGFTKSLKLNVTDVLEGDIGITLDNDNVAENLKVGTIVGFLHLFGTENTSGAVFELIDAKDGSPNDNALFRESRSRILTQATFDFEAKSEYTIHVKVTTRDDQTFAQDLIVFITDANDPPTDLVIEPDTFPENQPRGTEIGKLKVTDPDSDEKHTFEITGGRDRDLVYLKKDTVYAEQPFDFEIDSEIEFEVTVTDKGGAEEEFLLYVYLDDGDDAPIDIHLDNDFIKENEPVGTEVGTFHLDDPDFIQEEATFTLVEGEFDANNDLFSIEGATLKTAALLNFEESESYQIRVRGTDSTGLWVEKSFYIDLEDAPDPPTAILISNDKIDEDDAGIIIVGHLSSVDEDAAEYHTFGFQDHPEGKETDNDLFDLRASRSGASLRTFKETTHDFETKPIYNLYVATLDRQGNSYEQEILLYVVNKNEKPTDLEIDKTTFSENLPLRTEIATVSTIDPDLGPPDGQSFIQDPDSPTDQHTYALVSGEGDHDNRSFRIDQRSGVLTTSKVFDYEADGPQSIRVQSSDIEGHLVEKIFLLEIVNANDAPQDLSIAPEILEILESEPSGTKVGTLTAVDLDMDDKEFNEELVYSLVAGEGDSQNAHFQIIGNELQVKTPLVNKTTPIASVRIAVTDKTGESFEKVFTVNILNSNDAPSSITLDNASVKENQTFGTIIGNFSATDPDEGDSHTFSLVSGNGDSGNLSFFIRNGNQLVTNAQLDFEETSEYSIRVEARDSQGATLEQVFVINILDEPNEIARYELVVNRIPANGGLTPGAGLHDENSVVRLTTTPDPGYTFAGWTGDLPDGFDAGDKELTFKMDSDKTLTAHFARTFHFVDVVVSPDRHGYVSGGGSILHGANVTLTASELSGDDFVPFSHWRINGEDQLKLTDKSLNLKVEDDMDVEAVFDIGLPDNFVLIPAGFYTRDYKGKNEHITQVGGFYTSTHEISKAEWYEVYNWAINNGYKFDYDPNGPNGRNRAHNDKSYRDDYPITGVTWNDMTKWCNAKSEKEGWTPLYYKDDEHTLPHREAIDVSDLESLTAEQVKWRDRGYRLPTEAEWERAARGGLEHLPYPNGTTIDSKQAYYGQKTNIRALSSTTKHSRPPNGYGLYDISGNAWEACWDWYSKNWYSDERAKELNNTGPSLSETKLRRNYRTVRGGSGNSAQKQIQIDSRIVLKTWFQYAVTLRPVFPAPSEPDVNVKVASAQAHLGNVLGNGVYAVGDNVTLTAEPDDGAAFVEWRDEEDNTLGTSASLTIQPDSDSNYYAIFEDTSGKPIEIHTLLAYAEPYGSGKVTGTGAYLVGSTVKITATPAKGLDFAGWAGDTIGTNMTADVTILNLSLTKSMQVTGIFGDTSKDSDKDGLSDLYERSIGSNEFDRDTDSDKLLDGEEVNQYGSDPTKVDTDGDGHDDRTESLESTNLRDANEFPFLPNDRQIRYFTFRGKPYDYSGNKGHGTGTDLEMIADRWEMNKQALAFNGTTSHVIATGFNGVIGSGARAFAGWVRTHEGTSGPLMSYGFGGNGFEIRIAESGVLEVEAEGAILTTQNIVADDFWHHFIVSFPEGGTVGDIAIYIDGEPEAVTTTGSAEKALNTKSKSPLLIATDSSGNFLQGDLDDLRLWERNLVAFEAKKLYSMEAPEQPDAIAPNIIENPLDQIVAVGDKVILKVTAKGLPAPTYAWQKLISRTWSPIKGANADTYIIQDVQEEHGINYRVVVTNVAGTKETPPAKLTVLNKPTITEEIQDTALLVNQGGKIYAKVTGSAPLTYEWFKDGKSLGTDRRNYYYFTKTANQAEHGGEYYYKVTNAIGEIQSQPFNVEIVEAITITEHPVSQGILYGQSGSLYVQVTGTGNINYQWKKYDLKTQKYVDITGANESTYTIGNMTANDEGKYQCTVTNGPSTVSSELAVLTMYIAPTFRTQPRGGTVTEYGKLKLTSMANGDPTPTYQWQKFNTVTEGWEDLMKYKSDELYFTKILRMDTGTYRVVATNPGGSASSNEVEVDVNYKPVITKDLDHITANEGETITLNIEGIAQDTKGTGIFYQWYFNKKPVSSGNGVIGSATSELSISSVDKSHYGTWYVVLSNSIGTTQSRAIKLTVIEAPYSTSTLPDKQLSEGDKLLLSVTVQGSKPLTYQWYKDGKAISGADRNKLYLSSVSTSDSGTYTFKAENSAGTLELDSNVTVTASATTPTRSFVSDSPIEDSDGDGLINLLEEALGSDPGNPDSAYSPQIDVVEDGSGQQYLSFHYTENKSATGITTIVESSTDLLSWEPIDLNTVSSTQIDRGNLTETTLYIQASTEARFFRIRVLQE